MSAYDYHSSGGSVGVASYSQPQQQHSQDRGFFNSSSGGKGNKLLGAAVGALAKEARQEGRQA